MDKLFDCLFVKLCASYASTSKVYLPALKFVYVALRLFLPESIHLSSSPSSRYLYLTLSGNLLLGEINSILKGDSSVLRVIILFSLSTSFRLYLPESVAVATSIFLLEINKFVKIGVLILAALAAVGSRSLCLNW